MENWAWVFVVSWLRSRREHWAWMVVVEVRQRKLGVDGRGWGPAENAVDRGSQLSKEDEEEERTTRQEEEEEKQKEEKEEATDIKSNNPHLAGGEKSKKAGKTDTDDESFVNFNLETSTVEAKTTTKDEDVDLEEVVTEDPYFVAADGGPGEDDDCEEPLPTKQAMQRAVQGLLADPAG